MSAGYPALVPYKWYHGVITYLEMWLACTVLVFLGIMLLFFYVTLGLVPFNRESAATAGIKTVLYDGVFEEGCKVIMSIEHRI
ncbi:hypothetical protein MTO96_042391 [Rhipicephalus appendiculatus]